VALLHLGTAEELPRAHAGGTVAVSLTLSSNPRSGSGDPDADNLKNDGDADQKATQKIMRERPCVRCRGRSAGPGDA